MYSKQEAAARRALRRHVLKERRLRNAGKPIPEEMDAEWFKLRDEWQAARGWDMDESPASNTISYSYMRNLWANIPGGNPFIESG